MQTKLVSYSKNIYEAILDELGRFAKDGAFPDFSRTLVIVPGRQWTRNLKDAFADRWPNGVCPPKMLTPGSALHFASDASLAPLNACRQSALWERAVRKHVSDLYDIFPLRAGRLNDADFENVSKVLVSLRQELVKNGLTISEAAVALAPEDGRWNSLAKLEKLFLDELQAFGIADPAETDKLDASDCEKLKKRFDWIIVAFVPDMPSLLQKKLEVLKDRISVLVHASDDEGFLFDEWGRPVREWTERSLPLDKAKLHAFRDLRQAALYVLKSASDGAKKTFSPSESAIALARPSFFADFETEFSRLRFEDGSPLHLFSPEGVPGRRLRISRLVDAVYRALCEKEDFSAFSRLLRNGDFLSLMLRGTEFTQNGFISLLDGFMLDALPDRTPDAVCFAEKTVGKDFAFVLRNALAVLEKISSSDDFCKTLAYFLKDVFSSDENYSPVRGIAFDGEEVYWRNAIDSFSRSPVKNAVTSAEKRLKLLLDESDNAVFYPEHEENAVSVYNFLELPALKQRELFLVGVNNGVFPSIPSTTPFLTDTIRKKLGMACSETLYAVETYKLSALLRGDRRVHLIVLASDEASNPLRPSEMLFQGCSDDEIFSRAALCLDPVNFVCGEGDFSSDGSFKMNFNSVEKCDFFRHDPLVMSVTDFKAYMASPMSFLLKKAFRVDVPDYDAKELDDGSFGTACHRGFEKLSGTECLTEEDFFKVLRDGADAFLRRKCGSPLPFLVSLQQKHIDDRLRAAARLLASERTSYRLLETEYAINGKEGTEYGGVIIRGTIDRIELSADGKVLRLLDVKTFAKAKSAEDEHLGGYGKIINLQLPLYDILLRKDASFWEKHGLDPEKVMVEAGYLLIASDSPDAKLSMWEGFSSFIAMRGSEVEDIVRKTAGELYDVRDKGILPHEPSNAKYYGIENLFLPDAANAVTGKEVRND